MKTAKNARQEMIIKLIKEHDISTQEELTAKVKAAGFEATQATCSRDIKELGIIKITMPDKTTKYAVLDRTGDVAPGRLLAVFANSLISVQSAMNMLVIKTLPGMAAAAASALDSMHLEDVVGTIAGDDTVFACATGPSEAQALVVTIRDMMESGSGPDRA
ncbi:MAG: arginine repressor [Clostridiales bacterium]|jgi:transcriptional regulator of arginine metabolism|nr:arginine repressor [Clostridiales bacterium]MBQ4190898.1 arginine repressor [Clostridiales bacterium]